MHHFVVGRDAGVNGLLLVITLLPSSFSSRKTTTYRYTLLVESLLAGVHG